MCEKNGVRKTLIPTQATTALEGRINWRTGLPRNNLEIKKKVRREEHPWSSPQTLVKDR